MSKKRRIFGPQDVGMEMNPEWPEIVYLQAAALGKAAIFEQLESDGRLFAYHTPELETLVDTAVEYLVDYGGEQENREEAGQSIQPIRTEEGY